MCQPHVLTVILATTAQWHDVVTRIMHRVILDNGREVNEVTAQPAAITVALAQECYVILDSFRVTPPPVLIALVIHALFLWFLVYCVLNTVTGVHSVMKATMPPWLTLWYDAL
jgi:hypothetical protein